MLRLREAVLAVHASDALVRYVQALMERSRHQAGVRVGLSPRAGLSLVHAAQAWALMDGRDAVLPEDVQAIAPGVFSHRLRGAGDLADAHGERLAHTLLAAVAVP